MDDNGSEIQFVGIAASAGGLEASSALVKNLPADLAAVYIIAQHMAPRRESLLTSLIARETELQVIELVDQVTEPQLRAIYIPPPNTDVIVKDNQLQLVDPRDHPATPKPSADRLFISIAENCGPNCVGIVLSGTGSDGSYGVQAIREHGGLTIAQTPKTAKFDGMPASSIATGCIDLTLAPQDIGNQLKKATRHSGDADLIRPPETPVELHAELMNVLQGRTRIDFRDYKDQTINRRILRRMDALAIEDFKDYVARCKSDVTEVDILHKDLLISVTRFFRDADHFDQLHREIHRIVDAKGAAPIRVWIAGCATGEEAYTVAILVAEALGGADKLEQKGVQIFATDIDERALEIARKGSYPVTAAHDIPPDYLEKYFRIGPRTIDIIPELRAVTLFSKHNLFQDPPFINIDLVTLRNVLIYFKPVLQQRVLSRVHYSLVKRGLLLLGTSEAIRSMDLLFETLQGTDKIYLKNNATRPESMFNPDATSGNILTLPGDVPVSRDVADTDAQMFDALARSVAPNSFVITRGQDIIRVFGDVSPMLEITENTSLRLSTRILRRGLRDEAPGLIALAFRNKESRDGRWHNISGPGFNQVKMICFPIFATEGEDRMLVAFHTRMQDTATAPIESLSDQERTQYILQIETEMQSTREALQQTVEELQTTNEELQSVNEELQSTNEELQATNEELETSNEELQSTNEELITVNEEMQINSTEFQRISRELSALLAASPIPVLVVDHALLVRRASNSALSYFDIAEIPINGLHIGQLPILGPSQNLASIASNVIETREQETFEISKQDQVHKAIIAPFSEGKGNLLGLTISVFDNETGPWPE